jgi:hypothetical protein
MYFSFALMVSEEIAASVFSEKSGTLFQNTQRHAFKEAYLVALTHCQMRFHLHGTHFTQ